jgi:WD40 repeat protein
MEFEDVLRIADEAVERLRGRGLNDVERTILEGSWDAKSYEAIAEVSDYSDAYLKQDVGPKLWKLLSEALGRKVSKKTLKTAFDLYTSSNGLKPLDFSGGRSHPIPSPQIEDVPIALVPPPLEWGEWAVDVTDFYGRHHELSQLTTLVVNERRRLVVLYGMNGIGKTWLSQTFKARMQASFAHVLCLSLHQQPSPDALVARLLRSLTPHHGDYSAQPLDSNLAQLIHCFTQQPCLVILDDGDTVFQPQALAGYYRDGYGEYRKFLRQIASLNHRSCVIWVSQAEPDGLADLGSGVGILPLAGFSASEARAWLHTNSNLEGTEAERVELIERCSGHPSVIRRIVSRRMSDMIGRQIADLLGHWSSVVEQVQDQFAPFNQLTVTEQQVMYWLAIAQTPLRFDQLQTYMTPPPSMAVIDSLVRRSLCHFVQTDTDRNPRVAQPAIVSTYVLHRFLASVKDELTTGAIALLNSHALLTTQAPEYIQNQQRRLMLAPLVAHLRSHHYPAPQDALDRLLTQCRGTAGATAKYVIGNLINLRQQINPDWSDYDFSNMTIWQADLRHAVLQGANFACTDLSQCVFAQAIGRSIVLAFSPNGQWLATGNENGKTLVWEVSQGSLSLNAQYQPDLHQHDAPPYAHTRVRSLAVSPDHNLLAIGSDSHTIQLWDMHSKQLWQQQLRHPAPVRCVCFGADQRVLASSSEDRIYLWDTYSGRLTHTLTGHQGDITDLCFDATGQQLLSCSDDQTVRLWTVNGSGSHQSLSSSTNGWFKAVLFCRSHAAARLTEHSTAIAIECHGRTMRLWSVETGDSYCTLLLDPQEMVVAIAVSRDGDRVASSTVVLPQPHHASSHALHRQVKIWDIRTQQCIQTLAVIDWDVQVLAFSPDGQWLATGGDRQLALWDVETGQCLSDLRDPREPVLAVSFNHDQTHLITGQQNHAIRLWEIQSGRCHHQLVGHTNWVRVLAASPNGRWLASSSGETIRLWDMDAGVYCATLSRQSDLVRVLCFSPTASVLASGMDDATITLWDLQTRQWVAILSEHRDRISALCFSPDGHWLASGSYDQSILVWNTETGVSTGCLNGHEDRIQSLRMSLDGQRLVSASRDGTAKCWNLATGECQYTWHRPDALIHAVYIDATGRAIAASSGKGDTQTLQLWDIQAGTLIQPLEWEQASTIWSVTVSAQGERIAIGTEDGFIHVWQWQPRRYIKALRTDCPYEGMNIRDMTIQGRPLSSLQVERLKQLGAIER